MKLTSNGTVDTTFGANGLVTLDIGAGNDNPRTAIIQPDGRIVVSGHTSDAGVITTVLFRLLPDGQFDSTFGQNGIVHVALLGFVAEAYDVAFQGQNLIIAGYGRDASTGTVDIISARFLEDGTWDSHLTGRSCGLAHGQWSARDKAQRQWRGPSRFRRRNRCALWTCLVSRPHKSGCCGMERRHCHGKYPD
jgi:uncharacterized delta-60 repeat protein